jgi:ABC-2 type transport system permease protein
VTSLTQGEPLVDAARPAPRRVRTLRDAIGRNPVVLKELRGRMRGPRAFAVLTTYLLLMSGFVTLLYVVYIASTSNVYSGANSQLIGKFVFGAVVGIELLLVCFIAPAFTAGAISGERERQTYDLLRTTLLTSQALVYGKLVSAMSYIVLLLVAALPLQSLAFLLGGVALEEVLIATVLLLGTAFLFSASGIFFSSFMRRTLASTVLTYAFALMATLGLPLIMLTVIPVSGMFLSSVNFSPTVQAVLIYIFWALVSTNPIATAVATEVVLINEQTAFFFSLPLGGNVTVWLISPWLPYLAFCLVMGLAMIIGSILAVRRPEP